MKAQHASDICENTSTRFSHVTHCMMDITNSSNAHLIVHCLVSLLNDAAPATYKHVHMCNILVLSALHSQAIYQMRLTVSKHRQSWNTLEHTGKHCTILSMAEEMFVSVPVHIIVISQAHKLSEKDHRHFLNMASHSSQPQFDNFLHAAFHEISPLQHRQ